MSLEYLEKMNQRILKRNSIDSGKVRYIQVLILRLYFVAVSTPFHYLFFNNKIINYGKLFA